MRHRDRSHATTIRRCRRISASVFSEILITVFALIKQLSSAALRAASSPRGTSFAPSSFRCPYVPLGWYPARARGESARLLREGPRVSCNFHRVGGYLLFRITGSLREVRSRRSCGSSGMIAH